MSILDLFGINKNTQPVDAIRSGKELRERQENLETGVDSVTEELMKQNPELFNNLNTTGGITDIQPKAFNTLNNFYTQLTTPRIGNFGIMDLVNINRFASNPSFLGGLSFLPFAIGGLKTLYSNIKDPYKNALGGLNKQTRTAINREQVRDLQDRIDKGEFGSTTATPQDAGRGGQYDGGSGNTSGGFSSSERGAALHG
jgi:hypothetical protein|tara:strand:- start:40 stop:636 length:597 start_codon:yes stop_codon:yes gene_type:complete